jgi:hypothetical protein
MTAVIETQIDKAEAPKLFPNPKKQFNGDQIRAILKAIFKEGISVANVADLLCVSYDDIMHVLTDEAIGQMQAKELVDKPLEKWRCTQHRAKSFWGLLSMQRGQIKEIRAEDMEDLIKKKARLTERIRRARRYGMEFTREVKGRTLTFQRIR